MRYKQMSYKTKIFSDAIDKKTYNKNTLKQNTPKLNQTIYMEILAANQYILIYLELTWEVQYV